MNAPEQTDHPVSETASVVCRIIGVGNAGCSLVVAAWSSALLRGTDCQAEFACVTMGEQSNWALSEAHSRNPGMTPIQQVSLSDLGSGGNVTIAHAVALEHEGALRSLIDGADAVILVAGVGGGTGSAVTPVLARMARIAGVLTKAVVVTPFDWEIGVHEVAIQAIKDIECESDLMETLSNQAIAQEWGDQALLEDVFTQQTREAMTRIHKLMVLASHQDHWPSDW